MNTCAQKQTHVRAKEKGLRIPSVSLVNHMQTKQICGCGYTHKPPTSLPHTVTTATRLFRGATQRSQETHRLHVNEEEDTEKPGSYRNMNNSGMDC